MEGEGEVGEEEGGGGEVEGGESGEPQPSFAPSPSSPTAPSPPPSSGEREEGARKGKVRGVRREEEGSEVFRPLESFSPRASLG